MDEPVAQLYSSRKCQTTAVIEPGTLTGHRHMGSSAMLARTHTGFPVKRYEQPVAVFSDAVERTPGFR